MTPLIQQIVGLTNRIIPSGGTIGQVLGKNSSNNYDVSWITPVGSGIYDEIDPVFKASPAALVTLAEITNWNTAYSWGNPALAGYITTEVEPKFISSAAYNITNNEITNWNTAYGWGDPFTAGFLTAETDPIFKASVSYSITSGMLANWNQAYAEEHIHNNFTLLQSLVSNGNGSLVLTNAGTYVPITSIVVAGSDTCVQYNANGILSGSKSLTFNYTTTLLTAPFILATSQLQLGNSSNYITGDSNLTFTDATVGSHTLASLVGASTNYWTSITGGINYAGSIGINTPASITTVLTVNGVITATGFTSSIYQYTNANVLIGLNAGLQETSSNKLYVANSNTASPLIYGDFVAQYLTFNGSVYLPYGYDLYFNDNNTKIYWGSGDNLTFQDLVANSANPVTLASLINGTYNALKSDFSAYSSVTAITASQIAVWNKASVLSTSGSSTMFLAQNGNYYTVSGSGSMTWPLVAGIANYSGSNSWNTSYSVSGTNTVLVATNGSGAALTGITTSQILGLSSYATLASPVFTGTVTMPISLSGLAKLTAGVVSTATAGIDYLLPNGSGANLIGITTTQISGISSYATVASPTFTGTVTMPIALTGLAKLTSGVLSTAVANTDYLTPTGSGTGLSGIVTTSALTTTLANYATLAGSNLTTSTINGVDVWSNGGFALQVTASTVLVNNIIPLMTNPTTTTGDLIYNNGSGIVRLAIGTVNQILSVGGSGGPYWANNPSEPLLGNPSVSGYILSSTTSGTRSWISAMTNPMTTLGDIVYGGSSGIPTRLGIGTNGYFLTVASGLPAWGIITPALIGAAPLASPTFTGTVSGITAAMVGAVANPMTSTGDMITYNASSIPIRLAIGTVNQVLTVSAAGYPSWETYGLSGFTGNASSYNTSFGVNSLYNLTTGLWNTAIGYAASVDNSSGFGNTAVGYQSLGFNRSGVWNTAIGYQCLGGITGNNNVGIGNYAGYASGTGSNMFFVGNVQQTSQANDAAYSLMYGTFSGYSTDLTGQTLTINAALTVSVTSPQTFTGVVNLSNAAGTFYNAYNMTSGSLTITASTSPAVIVGGSASIVIIADGTHTITFSGTWYPVGGSAFVTTSGTLNLITFVNISGYNTYSIVQI